MARAVIDLRNGPFVVGTLSSLAGNVRLAGDIVEVRLDKTGVPDDWVKRCFAIETGGKPVLLTIRLKSEGGDWPNDDAARAKLFDQNTGAIAGIDVELSSQFCAEIVKSALQWAEFCVVSHHDFEKTPSVAELSAIIERAHQLGAAAKVATMLHSERDADTLRELLRKKWPQPVCVIGMGDAWRRTRVEFAKLGSCLTYGFLDKPTAPGQISAAELTRQLLDE